MCFYQRIIYKIKNKNPWLKVNSIEDIKINKSSFFSKRRVDHSNLYSKDFLIYFFALVALLMAVLALEVLVRLQNSFDYSPKFAFFALCPVLYVVLFIFKGDFGRRFLRFFYFFWELFTDTNFGLFQLLLRILCLCLLEDILLECQKLFRSIDVRISD